MVTCAIKGCGQRTGGRVRVRLFCIPKVITRECDKTLLFSRSRRAVWLERINVSRRLHNVKDLEESDIKPHIKVCSKHFSSGQPAKLFNYKSVDWAPFLALGALFLDPVANQEQKIQQLSEIIKKEASDENSDEGSGLVSNNIGSGLEMNHTESILGTDLTENILGVDHTENILGLNQTESILGMDQTESILGMDHTESILGMDHTESILGGMNHTDSVLGRMNHTDSVLGGMNHTKSVLGGMSHTQSILEMNHTESGLGINPSVKVYYNKVKVSDFAKIDKRKALDEEDSECDRLKRCNRYLQQTCTSWNKEPQHEPQVKLEVFEEECGSWGRTPMFCSSSAQTVVNSSNLSIQTGVNSSNIRIQTGVNCSSVSTQTRVSCSNISIQTGVNCSSVSNQTGVRSSSVGIQTDLTADNIVDRREFNRVIQDNVALRAELQNLKQFVLSEQQLAESNYLVRFYTGLPTFTMLKQVFDLVSSKVPHSPRNALSQFQEFLIIMMRLRLNLLEHDLGFRFGVSQSTVSKINDRWLCAMSTSLGEQILWPEGNSLDKTMTEVFRKVFGSRRVVIISCFEVSCDKIKQQKTVCFLIGITPHGKICFISKGLVGSRNDKVLTEDSGILDKLLPGDVLLADRGFNVAGCTGMYQPNPNFPIFTKGKTKLPSEDDLSYTTINVRTYVERINTGVKQKFRVLQNSVSRELMTTKPGQNEPHINYIVQICCALTNLYPAINDD